MTDQPVGWEAAYRKRAYAERVPHEDAPSLYKVFQDHEVRRILDLGCGDGRHLVYFAKCGYEMHGLDNAPTGIRLAEEWLAKESLHADLACCDMGTIPYSEEFFDAIICVQVINHDRIEGIRRTISEIYRVLRPGGWLFLTVTIARPTQPPENSVEVEPNTYVRLAGHEKGVPHHYFDLNELRREFSQFEVVDLHQDSRDYTCMLARKSSSAVPDREIPHAKD